MRTRAFHASTPKAKSREDANYLRLDSSARFAFTGLFLHESNRYTPSALLHHSALIATSVRTFYVTALFSEHTTPCSSWCWRLCFEFEHALNAAHPPCTFRCRRRCRQWHRHGDAYQQQQKEDIPCENHPSTVAEWITWLSVYADGNIYSRLGR